MLERAPVYMENIKVDFYVRSISGRLEKKKKKKKKNFKRRHENIYIFFKKAMIVR